MSLCFVQFKYHPNVCLKPIHGSLMIIVLYVDDLLITGSSKKRLPPWRMQWTMHFLWRIWDCWANSWVPKLLNPKMESKYISPSMLYIFLNKFKMKYCKPSKSPFLSGFKLEESGSSPMVNNTLYRQLIGCLIYLTHSRPDLSYAVSVSLRYMDQPHEIHWRESKRILNFVQGTRTHGIFYKAKSNLDLIGFTDSDWGGENIDQKYRSGYVFMLVEWPISCSSKK